MWQRQTAHDFHSFLHQCCLGVRQAVMEAFLLHMSGGAVRLFLLPEPHTVGLVNACFE